MSMRDESGGRARLLLGRLLSELGRDEWAAELLREAAGELRDPAPALVHLGVAYCRLGRFAEMVRTFREAVGTDAAAVRSAMRDEPPELEELRRLLHQGQPAVAPSDGTREARTPAHVEAGWALAGLGRVTRRGWLHWSRPSGRTARTA
jgi:hypothetical protein